MTKLKTVEEVAESVLTVETIDLEPGETIALAITQYRQSIREALREEITNMIGVYSVKDAIDKAVFIVDELLGGDKE